MILLFLLVACQSARPSDLDCAVAALDWVGPGGYVQDCTHGRCVVTTAGGCNVELECVDGGWSAPAAVGWAYRSQMLCPQGAP